MGNSDEISTNFVVGGCIKITGYSDPTTGTANLFLVLLHFIHDKWALACNNVFVQFTVFEWNNAIMSKVVSLKYHRNFKYGQKTQHWTFKVWASLPKNMHNCTNSFLWKKSQKQYVNLRLMYFVLQFVSRLKNLPN